MFSTERTASLISRHKPLVGVASHEPVELLDGIPHVNGRQASPWFSRTETFFSRRCTSALMNALGLELRRHHVAV